MLLQFFSWACFGIDGEDVTVDSRTRVFPLLIGPLLLVLCTLISASLLAPPHSDVLFLPPWQKYRAKEVGGSVGSRGVCWVYIWSSQRKIQLGRNVIRLCFGFATCIVCVAAKLVGLPLVIIDYFDTEDLSFPFFVSLIP